ncbi:MAG: iron-containing alcohol dehydrogenase, partial [Butyrivibrio sp.]|nr:iron-containing alcohol dehydrogenase [Butyrivibrio sp.]
MKALILNSGMGTRMGVLAADQPKCMTEVWGAQTIIQRQLEQLYEYGITEVVITTGAHDEVLQDYIKSLSLPMNIVFVYNEKFRETNYIYSIYCAKEYLHDEIILMHGDLVFENTVLELLINSKKSCMAVSSTLQLPKKDFKAVLDGDRIKKIGIDFFDNSVAAQPAYYLKRQDWELWLSEIEKYCESGDEAKRKCYAENAFNNISDNCELYTLDVGDMLCNEVDTPEDLSEVGERLRIVEERIVYASFSTDVIHSGHIALIKKARRLGKLIVGIISDDVVASYKRYPLLPFEERKALFENIVGVEKVVEQKTLSYRANIEEYKPAIVVHGDDWKEGFQKPIRDEVVELLSQYGGKLVEFPYANDPKYSILEKRIKSDQRFIYIENRYEVIDKYLADNHTKKIMVVCGNAVKYHPLYKHISESANPYEVVVFSDFCPNPKYESVCKGVQTFIDEGCDSILAIGGGSTIDVAKCIKLFATMDHTKNYLKQRVVENNIPLSVVPTTAGTGSEVTRFAVIYFEGIKQSISH